MAVFARTRPRRRRINLKSVRQERVNDDTIDVFGTLPDGLPVRRVQLTGGGLTAKILTYGAVLQDLRLDGNSSALVLGFEDFPPYLTDSPHFGATAGRCANRIRAGHLELDGRRYALDRNFLGKHTLHGGADGMGKKLWELKEASSSSAVLSLALPDGHMGFPGNISIHVTFSLLPEGVLDIRMSASADATTLCNLVHHSYFCLDQENSIANHLLQVEASDYLPIDNEFIPTGDVRAVAGTSFDFRNATSVGQRSAVAALDHNFCVAGERGQMRRVATLRSEASGIEMQVNSTEPGLQVYDGARLDIDIPGLDGKQMGSHAGIALEPQVWPDANHHEHFPQAILRPGQLYFQHTQYVFSRKVSI